LQKPINLGIITQTKKEPERKEAKSLQIVWMG